MHIQDRMLDVTTYSYYKWIIAISSLPVI